MEFPIVDFPACDNHPAMDADDIEMSAESFRRHCMMAVAPAWADLEWLRGITALPVVIKGILAPENAVKAAELGAEA